MPHILSPAVAAAAPVCEPTDTGRPADLWRLAAENISSKLEPMGGTVNVSPARGQCGSVASSQDRRNWLRSLDGLARKRQWWPKAVGDTVLGGVGRCGVPQRRSFNSSLVLDLLRLSLKVLLISNSTAVNLNFAPWFRLHLLLSTAQLQTTDS